MAFRLNGVDVDEVVLNGTSADELYLNDTLVFQSRSDQILGLFDGGIDPGWSGTEWCVYTETFSTVGAGCMWLIDSSATLTYKNLDFSKFDRLYFDMRGGAVEVYNGTSLLTTETPSNPDAWSWRMVDIRNINSVGDLRFVHGGGYGVYIDYVRGIVL